MAVTQDTLKRAGLSDPFGTEYESLTQRRADSLKREGELEGQEAGVQEQLASGAAAKAAALRPGREAMRAKLGQPGAEIPEGEEAKPFERPKVDPKELQETFGAVLVAAMLMGVGSRAPFYGAMNAMTGFMNGFVKQDAAEVDQAMKAYNTNLNAIKERNATRRQKYEDIVKRDQTDLSKMKVDLELHAAEFDDEALALEARSKGIVAAQQREGKTVQSIDTAIERLLATQQRLRSISEQVSQRRDAAKGKKAKDQSAERASERAVQIIDKMTQILNQNVAVTGVTGMGRRVAESAVGMLPGTADAEESPAHQYESLARELQQILRQTEEFHYKGRTLSREVADRDVMVRGLKLGDTGKISLDQLQHVRNMLTGEGAGFEKPGQMSPEQIRAEVRAGRMTREEGIRRLTESGG